MASSIPHVRGASRARGRGRGRGGFHNSRSTAFKREGEFQPTATNKPPKPRLTHFLALPLGHHRRLREKVSAFTTSLLQSDPPITGLDESIIIAPRRLHLTLGVMSLQSESSNSGQVSSFAADSPNPPKTLPSAVSLLQSLKPSISAILGPEKLRVALNKMDIMRPDRGDLEQAHVLWVGPVLEGDDARRLKDVCEMIHKSFQDAGLLVDERRPLKLHCTVINTVHRKPPSKGRRVPFSYSSVLASSAFEAIRGEPSHGKGQNSVDLGVWDVDDIQICEMGSHGLEGEYVSCGECSL